MKRMKNGPLTAKLCMSISLTALLAGCAPGLPAPENGWSAPAVLFANASDRIAFENANRRQWGAPVVADLDGDGWDDIVLNDHGHGATIFWNDEGEFTTSQTIIEGDVHGIGAEDYDSDGRIDLVIAQGGGDGGNPRNPVRFIVNRDRTVENAGVFSYFERGRGRAIKFLDANADGALDLIYTGFAPRNVEGLAANDLYLNRDGVLEHALSLPETRDAISFHMLITDFENDLRPDLIVYAGRDMIAVRQEADGSFTDATQAVLGELANTGQVSSIAELDYDNDGDMDLLLTRAAKRFESESYYDPETGRFGFFFFRDEFMLGDFNVEGDLVLENLQESYATHGIFVGADRREVKSEKPDNHAGGRLVIRPEDARGFPEGDLRGLHIGYIGDDTWRIGGDVHSRLATVVEGVKAAPQVKNRGPLPAMLLENQGGRFVDVTAALGINEQAQTTGVAAGDFDNDGWIDLALTYYGDMVHPVGHTVLLNKEGQRFEAGGASGLVSDQFGAVGNALSVIDFDKDGRLDMVFGNERGRWHLVRGVSNTAAKRGFFALEVGRSPQANAAITAARVEMAACGMTQLRVIGAQGDGFHHMASGRVHFGLGGCPKVESVKVTWSNGETRTLRNLPANSSSRAGRSQ